MFTTKWLVLEEWENVIVNVCPDECENVYTKLCKGECNKRQACYGQASMLLIE